MPRRQQVLPGSSGEPLISKDESWLPPSTGYQYPEGHLFPAAVHTVPLPISLGLFQGGGPWVTKPVLDTEPCSQPGHGQEDTPGRTAS